MNSLLRNLLSSLLGLALIALAPSAIAQFTFTTNNNALTITGWTGAGGYVEIPSFTNGLPVIEIGDNAFYLKTGITNVIIPSSITSIDSQAFLDCFGLISVAIGNNVTNIGSYAFWRCSALISVTIPSNTTSIADRAFCSCTKMASINVDPLNANYCTMDGVLFDKKVSMLIQYPGGKNGGYTIPNSVIKIGDYAFFDCAALTSVTIPYGVTYIGYRAFSLCSSLEAYNVDLMNSAYSSIDGVIFNSEQSKIVLFPAARHGSYTISNSVTSIESEAFAFCYWLTNVTICNSVTNIGDKAFDGCTRLTSFIIPDSITSIGLGVFSACGTLRDVSIPTSVTNIGAYAFQGCNQLARITIPDSVTSIEDVAFYNCIGLTNVYFKGNAPTIGGPFAFYPSPATIYYMPGTTGWSNVYAGRPTALWNPLPQTSGSNFGVRTNQFGFNIVGTTNIPIVVEATTNLASSMWVPLKACTLTNGSIYFRDPAWRTNRTRIYRIRSP